MNAHKLSEIASHQPRSSPRSVCREDDTRQEKHPADWYTSPDGGGAVNTSSFWERELPFTSPKLPIPPYRRRLERASSISQEPPSQPFDHLYMPDFSDNNFDSPSTAEATVIYRSPAWTEDSFDGDDDRCLSSQPNSIDNKPYFQQRYYSVLEALDSDEEDDGSFDYRSRSNITSLYWDGRLEESTANTHFADSLADPQYFTGSQSHSSSPSHNTTHRY